MNLEEIYALLLAAIAGADQSPAAPEDPDLATTAAGQAREACALLAPHLEDGNPEAAAAPENWFGELQQAADSLERLGQERRDRLDFQQIMDWAFAVHYVRAAAEILALYQAAVLAAS